MIRNKGLINKEAFEMIKIKKSKKYFSQTDIKKSDPNIKANHFFSEVSTTRFVTKLFRRGGGELMDHPAEGKISFGSFHDY